VARPRKITDERLLHAAGLVIARIGPKFVLADVAAEAGVATGTLMHRFGSKHGLLVAMIDGATAAIESDGPAGPAGPDGPSTPSAPGVTSGPDGPDPVRAVRDRIVAHYAALDDARSAANNLAQLAVDLADDDLRPRMARLHAAVERALEPLLADGFPGAPPPPVAARILAALADGTAIRWSAAPHGSLRERLTADIGAVLTAWRHIEKEIDR